MEKMTIKLTRKQLNKLNDVLLDYEDEGPIGSGWCSLELDELREIIWKQSQKFRDIK